MRVPKLYEEGLTLPGLELFMVLAREDANWERSSVQSTLHVISHECVDLLL